MPRPPRHVRVGSNCDVAGRRGHVCFNADSGRVIPGSPRSELRIMRYELSDHEWGIIGSMLPNKPRGVPRVDDRRVLNGMFWVLRPGAPWRDLPEGCGPHTTCYNRFVRWRRAGWMRTALLQTIAATSRCGTKRIERSIGKPMLRKPIQTSASSCRQSPGDDLACSCVLVAVSSRVSHHARRHSTQTWLWQTQGTNEGRASRRGGG